MSFPTLTVYGDSANFNRIRLFDDGEPADLTHVSEIALELDDAQEISSKQDPNLFNWRTGVKGVVDLKLGILWWPTRIFYAKVIVYDPANYRGIYWGTIRIRALENIIPVPE